MRIDGGIIWFNRALAVSLIADHRNLRDTWFLAGARIDDPARHSSDGEEYLVTAPYEHISRMCPGQEEHCSRCQAFFTDPTKTAASAKSERKRYTVKIHGLSSKRLKRIMELRLG